MSKDSLKDILLQHAQSEMVSLVEGLTKCCGRLLENESPKDFEDEAQGVFREFSGRLTSRALEALDEEVTAKIKARPHRIVNENGQEGACECGGRVDKKGKKHTSWDSTIGGLDLTRQTGQCKECGRWMGFLDEFLEITPQNMTLGCASAVALAGTCEAYESACTLLRETLQMELDDNRVRETVVHVSARTEGWMNLTPESEHLEEALRKLPTDRLLTLYVGLDGGRIRIRGEGWKEPCEAVLWWYDPETEKRTKLVFADVHDKSVVTAALDRAIQICLERNPDLLLVILADGAEWIWNWARKYEDAIKLLDYYHLRENVSETATALYGETDPPIKKSWTTRTINALWRGDIEGAIARLTRSLSRPNIRQNRNKWEAIDRLITYLENHDDLFEWSYKTHRLLGHDIGSGIVESTCKQLFSMRVKGPGMFWSWDGAEAVIRLRAVYLSEHWELLWQSRRAA